jgi:hypothetical protein
MKPLSNLHAILLKHEQAVIEVMKELSDERDRAAAAEREECAKVCEAGIDMWPNEYHKEWNDACENRAAAIRARGEK